MRKPKNKQFWRFLNNNFNRKITSAKIQNIYWKIPIATFTQPFQYDLQSSAAKDNSVMLAAMIPRNLTAMTIYFAISHHKASSLYPYGITTWLQSCSHSIAIWSHNFKKCIELRTDDATYCRIQTRNQSRPEWPQPAAHTRHFSSPPAATYLSEKTYDFVPRLSPKIKPM